VQFTLQRDQFISPESRWFIGTKPRIKPDQSNNNLIYAGYFRQLNPKLGLQVQGFYDIDFQNKNSKALAINMYQRKSKKWSGSYGYSYSRNVRGNIDTVFANLQYSVSDKARVNASFIKDLDNSESEISLGLRINMF